jgi:hypothetical protein
MLPSEVMEFPFVVATRRRCRFAQSLELLKYIRNLADYVLGRDKPQNPAVIAVVPL